MRRFFQFIDERNGKVLIRDGAVALVIAEQSVVPSRNLPVRWPGTNSAEGETKVQSRAFSSRSVCRNATPLSDSGLYASGKVGVSTSLRPGATSRLPAPPTTR